MQNIYSKVRVTCITVTSILLLNNNMGRVQNTKREYKKKRDYKKKKLPSNGRVKTKVGTETCEKRGHQRFGKDVGSVVSTTNSGQNQIKILDVFA